MRKLTLAVAIAAVSLPTAAFAQAAPAAERGARTDMSRAQVQARAEANFVRRDANQDGTIDLADREARRGQMFERIDADRNGAISRAEFDARSVTRAAARSERGRGGKQRMARRGTGERAMMGATAAPLTRQAFVDRALARFDRADADRNGTVTPAERRTLRETMRGQWRARAAARQQG